MKGRIPVVAIVGMLACLSGACQSNGVSDPWARGYRPPQVLNTGRVHLEPLSPRHAELDHAAAQSSREHLQRTLHWGSWPSADMTVDQNREDLTRHFFEFEKNEAYAYTVLEPDGSRCVGCVYLSPPKEKSTVPTARLAMWVTADSLDEDLDRHLFNAVVGWIHEDWPFRKVLMPLHVDNTRMIGIAMDGGFEEGAPPDNQHRLFVWQR